MEPRIVRRELSVSRVLSVLSANTELSGAPSPIVVNDPFRPGIMAATLDFLQYRARGLEEAIDAERRKRPQS
jgi:hypothetical protein